VIAGGATLARAQRSASTKLSLPLQPTRGVGPACAVLEVDELHGA
jgi:hypothetical protein